MPRARGVESGLIVVASSVLSGSSIDGESRFVALPSEDERRSPRSL
jgi:hypothetical protein